MTGYKNNKRYERGSTINNNHVVIIGAGILGTTLAYAISTLSSPKDNNN
ncbi:MAG: hypothetical protein P0116_01125 [Candidatus Nitrosocosmicus sp.]|nr:hypothetical protein [Candidatus Nitrosocosmicus sp.]